MTMCCMSFLQPSAITDSVRDYMGYIRAVEQCCDQNFLQSSHTVGQLRTCEVVWSLYKTRGMTHCFGSKITFLNTQMRTFSTTTLGEESPDTSPKEEEARRESFLYVSLPLRYLELVQPVPNAFW